MLGKITLSILLLLALVAIDGYVLLVENTYIIAPKTSTTLTSEAEALPPSMTVTQPASNTCSGTTCAGEGKESPTNTSSIPSSELSEGEREGILFIREEEKLARDVYLILYEKWQLNIFDNIARSEQTHMDAIKTLVEKYRLPDPVINEIGKFKNPRIQELYHKLVEMGSKSLVDALKVGAMIEELDIRDIAGYLEKTDKKDIIMVYENLMKGSRNHLRAFVSALKRHGATYTPQFISLGEFNEIISSPMETGSRAGSGYGGQGHRGGKG